MWGAQCMTSPVYPRVCGGSHGHHHRPRQKLGLSPRVRGKRPLISTWPLLLGSIPACAGEAVPGSVLAPSITVYPRVCGGSWMPCRQSFTIPGLSPRVRGKRRVVCNQGGRHRSIPACAGEAGLGLGSSRPAAVYPRVCGGSTLSSCPTGCDGGLSPRVRGKLNQQEADFLAGRSIPACAGEARGRPHQPTAPEVYPRVCGGSRRHTGRQCADEGLSPRVRGKRKAGKASSARRRSIPACAGEASSGMGVCEAARVYPRVCGGSANTAAATGKLDGLSPRVRGKQLRLGHSLGAYRSIPACAGEAPRPSLRTNGTAVYPRVCGGSPIPAVLVSRRRGLSPRVRGKLVAGLLPVLYQGSIPACAGEAR